jgi:hypothetical protein
LLAATVLPVVVGTTMPTWGPRVGLPRLLCWLGRYRAHRQLYPLWRDLCQAVPDVALVAPTGAWRDQLWVHRLKFRLHRRIAEIHDAQLALRPYRDPQAAETATTLGRQAHLDGEDLRAAVEAAILRAAVYAKTHARAELVTGEPMATPDGTELGADLESETAWLGKVAHAYARSSVVRAAVVSRQTPQHAAAQQPGSFKQP